MGHKIREIRIEKGMTQEELAERSGVSRVSISLIENGKITNVSSNTLRALADALGVSLDAIFFSEPVKST